MKTCVHLWQYRAEFFVEWEIFQIKVVEKIRTHILCSIIFFPPKILPFFLDNAEKYDTARQAIDDSTVLPKKDAICLPDN
jgi:hypothetical protein